MRFIFLCCVLWLVLPTRGADVPKEISADVIILSGVVGEDSLRDDFGGSVAKWEETARNGGARTIVVSPVGENKSGPTAGETQLDRFHRALGAQQHDGLTPLWLVMIGHGTYDGIDAKFNLEGPDLSASHLSASFREFTRPVVVVHCASASGAFLTALSATNRVVVTATKSGFEQNYARFGRAMAAAISDLESDLDHDGQVSLLEAFLSAAYRVSDFYKSDGRMLTEHALLDDNGDGKGTPAEWYRGIRAVKKAVDGVPLDGLRAHQIHLVANARDRALTPEARQRRDALEWEVFKIRDKKTELGEKVYYEQLEKLLLELGSVYPP